MTTLMPNNEDQPSVTPAVEAAIGAMLPGLEALWTETFGDPSVCVAILDGPVDISHPCFAGADLSPIETLAPGVADRGQATAHGTHVASLIFGQPESPVHGLAPHCRGLILPVFRTDSHGSILPCSQVDLARAITSAVQHGAHVINISGGELAASAEAEHLLENAVRYCAEQEVLIVAAAGNNGCECLHVPAALATVLAVGATDAQGVPMPVSNWGSAYQTQGLLAPGDRIPGANPSGGTSELSGTSFATAIVSGVVALLLSQQQQRGQSFSPQSVREALLRSAHACDPQIVADCAPYLVGHLNLPGAQAQLTTPGEPLPASPASAPELDTGGQPTAMPEVSMMNLNERNLTVQDHSPIEPMEGVDAAQVNGAAPESETPIDLSSPPALETAPVLVDPAPSRMAASTAPAITPTVPVVSSQVSPSVAAVAAPPGPSSQVYALGDLWYDLGTEAHRDSIAQAMDPNRNNPSDPVQLLAHLGTEGNEWDAAAVTWTLRVDQVPIYAIQPGGPFASEVYKQLQRYLSAHVEGQIERISVPGYLAGSTALSNGQVVPIIIPEPRGMYSWSTAELVRKTTGASAAPGQAESTQNFLERVYYELRNLGVTPQERAINFAATRAFHLENVFESASQQELELDRIEVDQSPVCRPESDCWDVRLTFFNPAERLNHAKRVYRFTIDVSDVIPVVIGPLRQWSEYT